MNKENVFRFSSYHAYLDAVVEANRHQRGIKTQLAKGAGCKPSFLSLVLSGRVHLTPDHAHGIGRVLELDPAEMNYFIGLVHHDRAGTKDLKAFYAERLREARVRINEKKKRGHTVPAKKELESLYYSSWMYGAIHVITSIPEFQTIGAISRRLGLPERTVEKILGELAAFGLVKCAGKNWLMGDQDLSLDPNSPYLLHHRANWRMKSLEKQMGEDSLHFTGVFSLSRKDLGVLREILLEALGRVRETIRPSKEEELGVVNIDVFGL